MASLLLLAMLACASLASNNAAGVRVELTRIHSNRNITTAEFVREALRRDMHRQAGFGRAQGTVTAPTQKAARLGEYLMTLAVGTPPLAYQAIADTGSDLIWTQCAPCSQCFKQRTALYNPARSSTFGVLPCNSSRSLCADGSSTIARCQSSQGHPSGYNYTYGTGWTSGIQGVETFTFGCSDASSDDFTGSAGIVGLGRGSQSLASQLGAGKFSYCLTNFDDTTSTSTLFLGPSAALNDAGVRSTPFVVPVPQRPYYYLNLKGISLGRMKVNIPPNTFSMRSDGTGGLIIDSGSTYTSLVDAAYGPVRAAVKKHLGQPLVTGMDLDLCSSTPPAKLPSMTFHFDGADMVLPPDKYMTSMGSGVWCLAMAASHEISIFGNYQQQNMHILYDIQNEMLSFAPADCSKL